MKPRLSPKRNAAMTLFEVGILVAVVMVVVIVFVPRFARTSRRNPTIYCVNNLKQVGLAYKIWAGDNGDIYPMGILVTNGGSMEMVTTGDVVQTYLVMSNELSTPKVIFCPADKRRIMASTFGGLMSSNVSYFVNSSMTNDANPETVVIGDSELMLGTVAVKAGLNCLGTNDAVSWSKTIGHLGVGNIGLADGSVQSITSSRLRDYFVQGGFATNRLAVP